MSVECFNYELLRPRLEVYAPEIARRMDAILERVNIHIDNLQAQSDLRVDILAPHMSFEDLCEMMRYYSENEDPFCEEVLRRIDHLFTFFYNENNMNISLQNTHTIITNQDLSMQQKY